MSSWNLGSGNKFSKFFKMNGNLDGKEGWNVGSWVVCVQELKSNPQ